MPYELVDADLRKEPNLPDADGNITSADWDLGPEADKEPHELKVAIPALTIVEIPDADTVTIPVQHGDAAAPTTAVPGLSRTLTGSSGIAAQDVIFALPRDIKRYVNVKITLAGGTGDPSAKKATMDLMPYRGR